MAGWVLGGGPIGVSCAVRDDGRVIHPTRTRTMRQDQRHPIRRADRPTLRQASANRVRTPARRAQCVPSRVANRERGPWSLPLRALAPLTCAKPAVGPVSRVRRKTRARGAALLDVMFTLLALTAGAQGFARWQAAGGMSSAELASLPKAVAMAAPAQSGDDAWRVRRQP